MSQFAISGIRANDSDVAICGNNIDMLSVLPRLDLLQLK